MVFWGHRKRREAEISCFSFYVALLITSEGVAWGRGIWSGRVSVRSAPSSTSCEIVLWGKKATEFLCANGGVSGRTEDAASAAGGVGRNSGSTRGDLAVSTPWVAAPKYSSSAGFCQSANDRRKGKKAGGRTNASSLRYSESWLAFQAPDKNACCSGCAVWSRSGLWRPCTVDASVHSPWQHQVRFSFFYYSGHLECRQCAHLDDIK